MKIYKKLVIDIESGETLHEDSYDYEGPLALCNMNLGQQKQWGSQSGSSSSYGSGSSSQQSGAQQTARSWSQAGRGLVEGAQGVLQQATDVGREFFGQLLNTLQTGGTGAFAPIVARALEGTKQASSRALRETSESLAQQGLAGTPHGERVMAQTRMQGAQAEAGVAPGLASQFLAMIAQALGQAQQTGVSGLVGARTEGSTSQGTSQSSAQSSYTNIANSIMSALSGGKGFQAGGGCCFIFLANMGYIHPVVRRYRDEHMTVRNRRGYYWLADRLVPLMRKYKLIKDAVSVCMVRPMISYGKYFYNKRTHGFVYAPITMFWLLIFTLLGFRPPYRRRGTKEVV